jgi:hypothetical protein
MADGLLTSILGAIDRQKQATKAGLGLLVNDPMEFARNATARYFPTPEEVAQQRAIEQAGGDTFNTPYMEKMFNLAQFQGSIKGIPKTQFDIANEIAQKNATEMLGLPPNNTAADRAKALGYDTTTFRGVTQEVKKLNPITYSTNLPEGASMYAGKDEGANVLPLLIRSKNPYMAKDYSDIGLFSEKKSNQLKSFGFDSAMFKQQQKGALPYIEYVSIDPSNVRSRFAAFDPAKVNSPDLLAAGFPLGLLAGTDVEMPKKKQKSKK